MLLGFHHVTAIASDPRRNLDFYAGFLGMRLVKRTVNFDDPGTYHFYFGDFQGSPGTLLTFFPWASSVRKARRGPGQVTSLAFEAASLDRWRQRAIAAGVVYDGPAERFGERVLTLRDPDGLPIELIESGSEPIGRLHSVTISESEAGRTGELLTGMLGFSKAEQNSNRQRFETGGARVDVIAEPEAEHGLTGPGSVHHMALAMKDEASQQQWRERLTEAGFRVTLPQNRVYFRSIYFRQPRGVLFELATTTPGFTVDEPLDRLGEHLCLPPWLEPARASIEGRLPPVVELTHG